jgi:hypothetical protein
MIHKPSLNYTRQNLAELGQMHEKHWKLCNSQYHGFMLYQNIGLARVKIYASEL